MSADDGSDNEAAVPVHRCARKRAAVVHSDEDSDSGDDVTKHALYSDEPDWSAVEPEARRRGVQVEAANTHAVVLGVDATATGPDRMRAFKRLSLLLHPDKHPLAPPEFKQRLERATQRLNAAKDAPDLSDRIDGGADDPMSDEGEGDGSQDEAQPTARQRQAEERRRAAEERRQAKQARDRAKAEEMSARATAFQQAARARISVPARALHGIQPWVRPGMVGQAAHIAKVSVDFAKVDACKVPPFGSVLKTVAGKSVPLLPTESTTLLIEAGCSAEKTRQLLAWLAGELETNPDMPILFVTCRKTHADDLWATFEGFGIGGFKNYQDAKGKADSKTAYMADATRLIVSLQSLHLINLSLYEDGLIAIDEARSAFSIPGGETLPQPTVQMQMALGTICNHAKYRVLMDADVSADGAVEAGLRIVAPMFNVLHVQLQQAALQRMLSLSFTGPKGSTGKAIWDARLTLWLLRTRWVRDEWARAQRAKMHVASVVLWLLERQWAREDEANGEPSADVERERQRQRRRLRKLGGPKDIERTCTAKWLLKLRERQWRREDEIDGAADEVTESFRESLRKRLRHRMRAAYFDRQRVLICCATPSEARKVAKMCDALGAPYHYYSGTTSDVEKREHFKNTTAHWFDAAVVIVTTTMTVAVNVRIHFSVVFLWCRRAEQAGRLRESFQAVVRVGRDDDDPLEDVHVYTLIPGEPPDFSTFIPPPQELRFKTSLRELKGESATKAKCEDAARKLYQGIAGGFDEPTPTLGDPMLELLAWNRIEGSDNTGNMAVVKLVELCKLPTRAWPIELTPALAPAEKMESDGLAQEEAPLQPDEAEDRRIGKLSMSEKFAWLVKDCSGCHLYELALAEAKERRASADYPVDEDTFDAWVREEKQRLMAEFFAEQENLRCSEVARPEKDARDIAKEKIYAVIEPLGCLPEHDAFHGGWFGQLAQDDTMVKLQRRAAALVMPLDEQRKVSEKLRRQGKTAHPVVVTPWHTQTDQVQKLAGLLELPFDRLLGATSYTDEDAWMQMHNSIKRGRGTIADKAKVEEVRKITKTLGAKVTKQMNLLKIVSHVLSDVLKLKPGKPECDKKARCNAATAGGDGRADQDRKWEIEDEWASLIPQINLPLLRPDGSLETRVLQSQWISRYEQLQNEAEELQRQDGWWMDVDEEEQLEADLRAAGPSDPLQPNLDAFVATTRRFDEWKKEEKYDIARIAAALGDLQTDEAERGSCTEGVFDRLATERQALGAADGFKAAGAVLLGTDQGERCVLLAREKRGARGAEVEKFNFIGGKREGREVPRETAAREAFEECAGLFTQQDRDRLESDPQAALTECFEGQSKAVLFAYELITQQVCDFAAGLSDYPVPSAPNLVRLEFVPLRCLLDANWVRSNLHPFCKTQLDAIRPWLQQYLQQGAAAPPMQGAPQLSPGQLAACRERVQKLERWYHALLRCEGLHEMLQALKTRADAATPDVDGRISFSIEYEQKGIGGRRYAKGELLPCKHGDHRPRSATLQGVYNDLRPVLVGERGHDIDCENGDFRLIASFPAKYQTTMPILRVRDYVANRGKWLDDIQRIHGVDKATAKRLPNIVSNGGSYRTWLDQNALPFIPRRQWYQPVLELQKELNALRRELFEHPQFKAMVASERDRLRREGEKTEFGIEASLMSRIVQTCENEVLGIVDRVFFDLGWDTLALVFDGLIVEPAEGCRPLALADVLAKAKEACKARGWDIELADKPLHGLQEGTPRSVTAARTAMRDYQAFLTQLG